jgi:hypothetical protein
MERDDSWYRIQGRLNALENLLILLVFDRAAVNPDPAAWIAQYVQQLRPPKPAGKTEIASDVDAARLAAEVNKAVQELLDVIEQRAAIFTPAGSKQ